jgi:hypothetical protein
MIGFTADGVFTVDTLTISSSATNELEPHVVHRISTCGTMNWHVLQTLYDMTGFLLPPLGVNDNNTQFGCHHG